MSTAIFTTSICKCNFSDLFRLLNYVLHTVNVCNWRCPIMQEQVHTSVFSHSESLVEITRSSCFAEWACLSNGAHICIMQLIYGYDECSLLKVWWADVRGFLPLFISSKRTIMKSLHIIIFMAIKLKESKSHCANDISSNMWGAGAMGEIHSWAEGQHRVIHHESPQLRPQNRA